jgi:hypothetical protein
MSRAIFYNFKNIFKNTNINNGLPIEYKINILGIILAANFCYPTITKEEVQINIQKKYKFDRNGSTEFMVIDNKGTHYNVNNSFWYSKWDSIEDWHSIELNKQLDITYYGLRIPLFECFQILLNSIIILILIILNMNYL